MHKDIKLIFKKNTLPISGILLLLAVNYILGITLTEYSKNIILIVMIVLISNGVLMYLTSILNFNDIVKYTTFAYLSFFDFFILTFFLYKDFLGSDNAFKLVFTILIFSNIVYVSLRNIFDATSSIVLIQITWMILKIYLII